MGKMMLKRRAIRTSKQMIESSWVWCDKKSNYMHKGVCAACKHKKKCTDYKDFQYLGSEIK
jgi:hypothetical protein